MGRKGECTMKICWFDRVVLAVIAVLFMSFWNSPLIHAQQSTELVMVETEDSLIVTTDDPQIREKVGIAVIVGFNTFEAEKVLFWQETAEGTFRVTFVLDSQIKEIYFLTNEPDISLSFNIERTNYWRVNDKGNGIIRPWVVHIPKIEAL